MEIYLTLIVIPFKNKNSQVSFIYVSLHFQNHHFGELNVGWSVFWYLRKIWNASFSGMSKVHWCLFLVTLSTNLSLKNRIVAKPIMLDWKRMPNCKSPNPEHTIRVPVLILYLELCFLIMTRFPSGSNSAAAEGSVSEEHCLNRGKWTRTFVNSKMDTWWLW